MSSEVVKVGIVYLSTVYAEKTVNCFDIRTEYPCKPMADEVVTVSALPTNGYIGAKVNYNGGLYIYNGSAWKAQ